MYKQQGIFENRQDNASVFRNYGRIGSNSQIHPTAIVDINARIGDNVKIGPYCVVGPHVTIGNGCELKPHVIVDGHVVMGRGNRIFSFAVIGQEPQDLKYEGEESSIRIGNNNRIREHCTIHPGTKGDMMVTEIGNNNLLMINVHIAHDCVLGNNCVLANNVALGGHVRIGDYTVIGGLSAVHQKVRIGRHAMIGGMTAVAGDVVPYGVVAEARTTNLEGVNIIGLKRRNFSRKDINELRNFYRDVFQSSSGDMRGVVEDLRDRYENSRVVCEVIEFLSKKSDRYIISGLK
ncbi:MAG: acyl-ACP--UDP-N-acetylglucosamine O-acyltransferase [Rickettsiales bacterium]|jgi:UDP-N-acetylglucosamine acyltransferase|nr:acyl-ACP--UDP-N-acetylglucosamine O-acyltransferase [Rickettsiales bacterium]